MSLLTFVLFYVLAIVHAVPLVKRIVVSPQITSPTASTVWTVGNQVTVTWCVQPSLPLPGVPLCGWLIGDLGTPRASRRQTTLLVSSYSVT